jgi:ribosomal protein S18 acetylase RimI-like enzyme
MSTFDLRFAKPEDAASLSAASGKIFRETFGPFNQAKDIDLYIAQAFNPEKQLEEILDPRRKITVAFAGDKIAGFAQLLDGKPEACVTGKRPIELLRLYVDSAWHGKGLAHELMEQAVSLATQGNFATLWLGVWEENHRAQAFYRKWNFQECGDHVFVLGTDPQRDLIFSKNMGEDCKERNE